jgi:hypothetical protein
MTLSRVAAIFLVAMILPVVTAAQKVPLPASPETPPDFRLVVLGHFDVQTLADFNQRVQHYAELRRIAERDVPPLRVTDNADDIIRIERMLTARIREVRGSSDRGQIISRRMERQLKDLFVIQVDTAALSVIMDDGPGEFDVDVNDTYARYRSLATMPTNILLLLPALAEDMEYRFVGRHLIVRDVRANMIIDEIPYALSCEGCVIPPERLDHDEDDGDRGDRERRSE